MAGYATLGNFSCYLCRNKIAERIVLCSQDGALIRLRLSNQKPQLDFFDDFF